METETIEYIELSVFYIGERSVSVKIPLIEKNEGLDYSLMIDLLKSPSSDVINLTYYLTNDAKYPQALTLRTAQIAYTTLAVTS